MRSTCTPTDRFIYLTIYILVYTIIKLCILLFFFFLQNSLFGIRIPHALHGRNVHQDVRPRHSNILRLGVQSFRLCRHCGLHIRSRVVGRQRWFVRSVRTQSIEAVTNIQSDEVSVEFYALTLRYCSITRKNNYKSI